MCTHNVCFEPKYKKCFNALSKNMKNNIIKIFPVKFSFFRAEKSMYIAWASFRHLYSWCHFTRCFHVFSSTARSEKSYWCRFGRPRSLTRA